MELASENLRKRIVDEQNNRGAKGDTEISADDSAVRVYVIHSQETWQVGWEALRKVRGDW
jgi:acetate kinase